MEKVKEEIKKGITYHLTSENKPENILLGDEVIFNTLFNEKLNVIKKYRQLNDFTKDLIYKKVDNYIVDSKIKDKEYLAENEIDKEIINIINSIDNEFIKYELLELNSGKKKMIRGKLSLNTQQNKDFRVPALIELFHLATLIQDDVIDKAKYRRFKKTISSKYNNEVAILISDILFMTVILNLKQLLQEKLSKEDANKKKLEKYIEDFTYELITRLIYSEKISKSIQSEKDYINYATYKTSNLFTYTITLSYILDNKDDVDYEKLDCLKMFANDYGLLFQKVDDTIDYEEEFQKSGKDSKDKANDINNYVFIMLKKYTYNQIKSNLNNEIEKLYDYEIAQNYKEEIKNLKRGLND